MGWLKKCWSKSSIDQGSDDRGSGRNDVDRDRKGPYSPSLSHHRAYGSVYGGSDSYALLLSDNLGSPSASK